MDGGAWWATVRGVAQSRTRLSKFTFTFHFHALEKEMATHSSVLAWRIPGMGEPDGLPSMGSHRVGHDWSDLAAVAAATLYLPLIAQLVKNPPTKQETLLKPRWYFLCPYPYPYPWNWEKDDFAPSTCSLWAQSGNDNPADLWITFRSVFPFLVDSQ